LPVKQLADLISAHGYWIVAVIVAVESMGVPAPGETALVTAAIFAATTRRLDIVWVVAAAAIGAIVGDNIGYLLGRRFGYSIVLRYGRLAGFDEKRIKLGRYLFARHGGKVVFFGRFIAVLRAAAAVLAGTNCMDWRRFLLFNASGGVFWAAAYGTAGYVFGERVERLHGRMAVAGVALAVAGCAAGFWWLRRHEAALLAAAERALPGPLPAAGFLASRK
jgi:membrane protein DedA with SNARE-associated domain